MTVAAAESLGPLLRDASIALKQVTGCQKTYVVMFAEAEGFYHLHFHVVPRLDDLPSDRRGPNVFAYLRETPLDVDAQDRVARAIRDAWPAS
jgi:diadenosine tetraphosphate (Ap4A) HIT family hydrolase